LKNLHYRYPIFIGCASISPFWGVFGEAKNLIYFQFLYETNFYKTDFDSYFVGIGLFWGIDLFDSTKEFKISDYEDIINVWSKVISSET